MKTETTGGRPASVLIVDDEPSIRVTLSAFLSHAGYEVATADDAEQAVALLEWRAFDVVVTDLVMPRLSGLELIRRVRELTEDTVILVMTGEPTVETAVEAVRVGALDYLIKPVNKETILRHVGYAAKIRGLMADKRRLEAANAAYQQGLERLVAERTRSLLASEEWLRMALEAARAVAWAVDLATGALQETGPVAEVFGHPAHAAHRDLEAFVLDVHPDDREAVRRELELAIRGDGDYDVEFRVTAADGETRWIHAQGRAGSDDDGPAQWLRGIARDVSEQHHMQTSLAQADRLATMGMLAAGVAHEINNPLSYLLYHLETLVEELPAPADDSAVEDDDGLGPTSLLHRAEEALQGASRIRAISRALGAFSRVEDTDTAPVQLHNAVDHACRMAQNELKYRARLVLDLAPELPLVLATEGKLAQVVLNLLVNAAHAMDERDSQRNEVGIRTWRDGDQVHVAVRDNGRGMAPDVVSRIFEPFFTTKPVGVGSGLGLPICRDILTAFGGEISVTSEAGVGTSFEFWLPAVAQPDQPAPAAPPTGEPVLSDEAPSRVLVVDDDAAMRRVLHRVLRRRHTVVLAGSGAEALAAIEANPAFDAIVCDVMMPDVHGVDLHLQLVKQWPELAGRVIFVSGGAFTPRARDYLASVDNVCLAKPFEAASILAAIDALRAAPTT